MKARKRRIKSRAAPYPIEIVPKRSNRGETQLTLSTLSTQTNERLCALGYLATFVVANLGEDNADEWKEFWREKNSAAVPLAVVSHAATEGLGCGLGCG